MFLKTNFVVDKQFFNVDLLLYVSERVFVNFRLNQLRNPDFVFWVIFFAGTKYEVTVLYSSILILVEAELWILGAQSDPRVTNFKLMI